MSKPRILVQLDTDDHPSVFDAVVAIDAGADFLLPQCNVTPENVQAMVYGAIFTRGPKDLSNTALFVGGNDVAAGEAVVEKIRQTFFGPMRVSVMMDSSGANTTAAAAVLAALKHLDLSATEALVLGATGPVGQRVVRLLAGKGARVRVGSRSAEKAAAVCATVSAQTDSQGVSPCQVTSDDELAAALKDVQLVVSSGPPGVRMISAAARSAANDLKVAIDLNAVPPLGLDGVDAQDKAAEHDGVLCYGALGIGGTKMKIHKAAIARLFESNDQHLDAEEMLAIGQKL